MRVSIMAPTNYLLGAFPPTLVERLAPHLQNVMLRQGEQLHISGDVIHDLYFPIDCVLSITLPLRDGSSIETGLVGKDELLGIEALLGSDARPATSHIVQIAGLALKIKASILREEFDHNQDLRDVVLRYTQALLAQVSQTSACNRLHTIDQRLARWLLEIHSRIERDQLILTQEFIATMLGVRRAGITLAAQKLQDSGLIRYNRGHVHILNQAGLQAYACECFQMVKNEYERLLRNKRQGLP